MFDNFDNGLDPKNIYDAEIIRRKAIYEAWTERHQRMIPSPITDEDPVYQFDINTYTIIRDLAPENYEALAEFPSRDLATLQIQEYLIEAMDHRNLHFPAIDAYAIAAPDEADENPARLKQRKIIQYLDNGYDLTFPLKLTKELDGEIFDFFFALKMTQISPIKTDEFFQYHLDSFCKGDRSRFARYLQLLMDEYGATKEPPILADISLRERAKPWTILLPEKEIEECDPIEGSLHATEIVRILTYFGNQKNDQGETYLHPEDLKTLIRYKFSMPPVALRHSITIRLKPKQIAIVYTFFYWIWSNHSESTSKGKIELAKYLESWFTNFKDRDTLVISKSIKPPRMKVNLEWNQLLPDRFSPNT
jgi:hypothetical protein